MSSPDAITYDCEGVRRSNIASGSPADEFNPLCCPGCHEQAAYAERQFKGVAVRVCCALEDDLDTHPDDDDD